jgi:hypothetical protein
MSDSGPVKPGAPVETGGRTSSGFSVWNHDSEMQEMDCKTAEKIDRLFRGI